ncbi:MAG: zinc ABC transporter substrate-binding protein [Oscillospiraceae bacterium]|nr:zinc ABC transporter substrate-binding protein [Oscillospiraceae bacterium]
MKRLFALLGLAFLLCGCASRHKPAQIAATTAPVYEFTQRLCQGTNLTVSMLITENVSCLHDYSLSVSQVKAVEGAELLVLSGAGLEAFMDELLNGKATADSSESIHLLGCEHEHDHGDHAHEDADPHIWLSPENAMVMATNICASLCDRYSQYQDIFETNLQQLLQDLQVLQAYGKDQLADLPCRELITFHDGFAYFAQAFDLTILKAVEEESGSEASAGELKELCGLVREHQLPAVFTEVFGSTGAAEILSRETGVPIFQLDMAMSGSYFDAMYHNIDTVKEALG